MMTNGYYHQPPEQFNTHYNPKVQRDAHVHRDSAIESVHSRIRAGCRNYSHSEIRVADQICNKTVFSLLVKHVMLRFDLRYVLFVLFCS